MPNMTLKKRSFHYAKHHIEKTIRQRRHEACPASYAASPPPFPSAVNQRPTMRCPLRSAQKARPWDPQESDVMRKRPCSLGERQAFRPIQAQPVCRHGSPSAKAGSSLAPHDMQHRLCARKSLGIGPLRPSKILSFSLQAGHLICQRLQLRLTCRQ